MEKKKLSKIRLKEALHSLKSSEQKSLLGGHGCTGFNVDCFCEPHCISGSSCTNGWY